MSYSSLSATILNFFEHHKFLRNVITLMTGSTVAQVISFAVAPILTRIYEPHHYGLSSLYISVVGMIATVSTGNYEHAIMLPQDDEDAINILILSTSITIGVCLTSLIVLSLCHTYVIRIVSNDEIAPWLFVVPFSVLIIGISRSLHIWINRTKQYRTSAMSQIIGTTTGSVTNLVLGIAKLGTTGLILGGIAGQSVAIAILSWNFLSKRRNALWRISTSRILHFAKVYADFPKYNMIQGIFDSFRINLIVLSISFFFDATVLGHYALSMRLFQLPIGIIGAAVGQVFYQKAAETYRMKQDLWAIQKKVIFWLSLVSIPLFLIILGFAPILFRIGFGDKWKEAGVYSQILCPYVFINFLVSPLSKIPLIVNRQKQFLIIGTIYNFLVPVVFIMASVFQISFKAALGLFSFSGSLYLIIVMLWFKRIAQQGEK
ncbi:MAG: oligosaccharide flippase family protein [Candidatus Vecturithrix sp.]|jgi:O-antigen/teichoic acid export membrane protein|nr:oligosaccharide flippase family protein [Candidatus Vecturithrix sp.]